MSCGWPLRGLPVSAVREGSLAVQTLWLDADGAWRTSLRGRQVLTEPRINKGTAFSDDERASLGLIGLIPPGHLTLEQQASRVYAQFLRQSSNLARNVLLNELHSSRRRTRTGSSASSRIVSG